MNNGIDDIIAIQLHKKVQRILCKWFNNNNNVNCCNVIMHFMSNNKSMLPGKFRF